MVEILSQLVNYIKNQWKETRSILNLRELTQLKFCGTLSLKVKTKVTVGFKILLKTKTSNPFDVDAVETDLVFVAYNEHRPVL